MLALLLAAGGGAGAPPPSTVHLGAGIKRHTAAHERQHVGKQQLANSTGDAMQDYVTFLSGLPPIPCRDDLARVAQARFFKTGDAVEVGVFQGDFSRKNLRHWRGKYFQVDAWTFRPNDDPTDKNFAEPSINAMNRERAWSNVHPHERRTTQIAELSHLAAQRFHNASIDWVYIDALHTEKALYDDLTAWYPKVRPGGLISGDDYGDTKDTSLMTSARWNKTFGRAALDYSWGVISALERFTRKHGLILHATWAHDCYRFPAWYMVKRF